MPGTDEDNEADESTKGTSPFAADGKADELEKDLDDVRNHEDHRLKGGRELKASA
jgi:hypothetical protein